MNACYFRKPGSNMSGWLRNIQGQLTDLANEVLNEANEVITEAREEVPDPSTELQVAKKKCAEAEKQLAIEVARVKSLEEEKKDIEEQLNDARAELETQNTKFTEIIRHRDQDIKRLNAKIAQLEMNQNDDGSEVENLRKEANHWKSIVDRHDNEMVNKSELEKVIEEMRQKKEEEIQNIMQSHAETVVELREMYEEKIQSLQNFDFSSTSNADTNDAIIVEKDDLARSKVSTNGSDNGEHPVIVDLASRDELAEERIRQLEAEIERMKEENERVVESLKAQNEELACAYNEVNNDFEEYKKENAVTENRNIDLTNRIESLKANLIEYEERYELCRQENVETVAKLEKLSDDFERLRNGVADVSQRRENCDQLVNDEVEKLREALDESRQERERLRNDVQRFQVAVGEIDEELEKLRENNRRLLAENMALTENLNTYDSTMRGIISSSENDIKSVKEQFKSIQESHDNERGLVKEKLEALEHEVDSLKKQNGFLLEESKFLREVNETLKMTNEQEGVRVGLLEEKNRLLEEMRTEMSTELGCLREELKNRKENVEKKEESTPGEQKEEEHEDDGLANSTMSSSELDGEESLEKLKIMVEQLNLQISELLKTNREKSDECETLRVELRYLEKEVEIRQSCVDEMIAQTNALQMQQHDMSSELTSLKAESLNKEREYLKLRSQLEQEKEHVRDLNKMNANLESIIKGTPMSKEPIDDDSEVEDDDLNEKPEEAITRLKTVNVTMRRFIKDLKKRNREQADELEKTRQMVDESGKESEEVRLRLVEAEHIDRGMIEKIEERVLSLESMNVDKDEKIQQLKREIAEERNKKALLENEISTLTAEKNQTPRDDQRMTEYEEEVQKVRSNLAQISLENEEMKKALLEKHAESVEYYNQLQQFAQRSGELEAQMAEMKKVEELSAKRAKELERLKQHLLIVEEASTREAVDAEQRETELRERIKELEANGMAVAEGASESTQQYQVKIAELTAKLESLEKSITEWKSKCEAETAEREQTSQALNSLQNVVRELSTDHERDLAAASHRSLELEEKLRQTEAGWLETRDELERAQLTRQSLEDDVERWRSELESKQKIIEQLEIGMEDLRASQRKTDTTTYRVDDETLRQLFMNYFTAEVSKRADIAVLLASILEYNPEDMEKIRKAIKQTIGGSSSLGSAPSSITEQFIRFLEIESESSRTAPNLPLRTSQQDHQNMSIDTHGKSQNDGSTNQSASSGLDSLLR